MKQLLFAAANPNGLLNLSARACFSVTALGQWIFAIYIGGFYFLPVIAGEAELWDRQLPPGSHGYEAGNLLGNLVLASHLLFAVLLNTLGPLQLIPKIRSQALKAHRWSGRVYMLGAFILALGGIYLLVSDRKLVGDLSQHIAIGINAFVIIGCAIMALRHAIKRQIGDHRRWALRLFWAASGVWLFRVGLMAWLIVFQRPVGFDMNTFSGPFLTVLAIAVYVLPVFIVELYLRAREQIGQALRLGASATLTLTALVLALGVIGATMGMWIPRLMA